MSTNTAPTWIATLISRSKKDTTQSPGTINNNEAQIQDSFLKLLQAELVMEPFNPGPDGPLCKSLHDDAQKNGLRMDITFEAPKNSSMTLETIRGSESIGNFEARTGIDIILQQNTEYRKHKKLIVFDMDSTLIQQEVIDEIAAFVGVKAEVAAITERAMNGELDFSASLKARVALLKGVPSTVFESLKSTITFTPGARELCRCLKKLGCKLAVLSGGFMPLAEWVKHELGLDYAFANNLEISDDGKTLSGTLYGDIVNAERKAYLLEEIAEKEGIDLRQAVAIGDGANDLLMMKKAGFGIAFNAKPKVQREAPSKLNTPTLLDVLYILGYTYDEQEALLK